MLSRTAALIRTDPGGRPRSPPDTDDDTQRPSTSLCSLATTESATMPFPLPRRFPHTPETRPIPLQNTNTRAPGLLAHGNSGLNPVFKIRRPVWARGASLAADPCRSHLTTDASRKTGHACAGFSQKPYSLGRRQSVSTAAGAGPQKNAAALVGGGVSRSPICSVVEGNQRLSSRSPTGR